MGDHLHEQTAHRVGAHEDNHALQDLSALGGREARSRVDLHLDGAGGQDVGVARVEGGAGDERMVQGLPRGDTIARVANQQALHEVHAGVRDVLELLVREGRVLGEDRVVHVLDGFAVERRRAGQQHVAQHAERPDIAATVVVAVEHLGGGVVAGADLLGQALLLGEVLRQTEVDENQRRRRIIILEQEVLQLQISMDDAILVQIVDRGEHVAHQLRGAILAEDEALVLAGVQQLEQLSTATQVRDDVN